VVVAVDNNKASHVNQHTKHIFIPLLSRGQTLETLGFAMR